MGEEIPSRKLKHREEICRSHIKRIKSLHNWWRWQWPLQSRGGGEGRELNARAITAIEVAGLGLLLKCQKTGKNLMTSNVAEVMIAPMKQQRQHFLASVVPLRGFWSDACTILHVPYVWRTNLRRHVCYHGKTDFGWENKKLSFLYIGYELI